MVQEIIKTEQVLGKVLHVYGTPENPLFVAADVAAWIGHSNPTMMVNNIDNDEKLPSTILRAGLQQREVVMLTEFGLYEVLFQSRKPIAKAFKKEVKRILKELRVHGVTASPAKLEEMLRNPDTMITVLQTLKKERVAKELAEKQLALQQPKVKYYDEVLQSKELIPITVIAKNLGKHATTLNRELHNKGIIFPVGKTWVLYAQYQNKGYAYHKVFTPNEGPPRRHLYWTEKGFEFIYNLFKA